MCNCIKEKIDNIIEFCGWLGTLAILCAYFLTTSSMVDDKHVIHSLNLFGSFVVGIVCFKKRAWQPLLLQIAWGGISIYGFIII